MKLSARNILKGMVVKIKRGPISTLVTLQVAPQVEVVAVITSEGAGSLKLKQGPPACAIIKASSILIGVDE